MKRIIITTVMLTLMLNHAFSFCFATEDESDSGGKNNAIRKLFRGVCNVGTCYLEVPAQMGKMNEESGPIAAGSLGLFQGIFSTCVRIVVGAYEITTFPIPFPPGYKPILNDPEFFYSDRTW